jgi:hypothetical protein
VSFLRRTRAGDAKAAAEVAPEGVRIITPSGVVIACDVLRDPDGDTDGCAAWLVVPHKELPADLGSWQVTADMLPGKSILCLSVPVPEPEG